MIDRAKFEAWADKELPYPLTRQDDGYNSLAVQCAWVAWTASRAEALEEAAQVADQADSVMAKVIRALKGTGEAG